MHIELLGMGDPELTTGEAVPCHPTAWKCLTPELHHLLEGLAPEPHTLPEVLSLASPSARP